MKQDCFRHLLQGGVQVLSVLILCSYLFVWPQFLVHVSHVDIQCIKYHELFADHLQQKWTTSSIQLITAAVAMLATTLGPTWDPNMVAQPVSIKTGQRPRNRRTMRAGIMSRPFRLDCRLSVRHSLASPQSLPRPLTLARRPPHGDDPRTQAVRSSTPSAADASTASTRRAWSKREDEHPRGRRAL